MIVQISGLCLKLSSGWEGAKEQWVSIFSLEWVAEELLIFFDQVIDEKGINRQTHLN